MCQYSEFLGENWNFFSFPIYTQTNNNKKLESFVKILKQREINNLEKEGINFVNR